jgi:hypothetical protein
MATVKLMKSPVCLVLAMVGRSVVLAISMVMAMKIYCGEIPTLVTTLIRN